MSKVLSKVDERTQLVGHNRMELLLFRLDGKQRYGINVFKVREVISCPALSKMPNAHPAVVGITNLRGSTISVIDLQMALGKPPVENVEECSVIVAEYNRSVQGFLVPKIEHIINKHWEEILAPPRAAGKDHYLTAVTRVDDEIVEILDVERILYDINGHWGLDEEQTQGIDLGDIAAQVHVLVADDSSVARNQIKRTLDAIGVPHTICVDGRKALYQLREWRDHEPEMLNKLAMVISDVEMPEMDGYTLTAEIRKDPALAHLKILLHTSLSGVFDSSLVKQVKADGFLSKFDSGDLGKQVTDFLVEFAKQRDKEK